MKIISIVGARPQFIKLAPLSVKLRRHHRELIVHTGQHFDPEMSDLFFNQLKIARPDYHLNVNKGNHGDQTARMLIELERVLHKEKPDMIIVFGDTNSTLAGALAGAKMCIPIVHIEAGLRSHNRKMPEEINRVVVDHIADHLFAPTKNAMKNLALENLAARSYLTGDIMADTLKTVVVKSTKIRVLEKLSLEKNKYNVLTLHRPYNVDNRYTLSSILNELGRLSIKVVFPVHPRTCKTIKLNNIVLPKNIILIRPLGYLEFVKIQANALKVITDSGGIQKEAYILKKPCVTLRSETEWVETVESGWNLLVNPTQEKDYSKRIEEFQPSEPQQKIFGEKVAEKMAEIISRLN